MEIPSAEAKRLNINMTDCDNLMDWEPSSADSGDRHVTQLLPTPTNSNERNDLTHDTPSYPDAVVLKQPLSTSALGPNHGSADETDFLTDDESEEAPQEKPLVRQTNKHSYSKEMNVDSPACDAFGPTTPAHFQSAHGADMYRSAEEINGLKPSAPLDEATVYINVDWPRENLPHKWESILEKSLQSWFNKHCARCSITNRLVTGCSAEIKIHPSSALEALLQQKTVQLNFKDSDNTSATVHFHKRPTQKPQTTTSESIAAAAPSMYHNGMLTHGDVPLLQYWYVAQAFSKEMERIEKENGVKITAEVKVSIKEDPLKTTNPLPTKAFQEFTDLFQKCSGDMDYHTVSLKDADQRDPIMNTLRNIQYEEAKLVLSASSKECSVFGPRQGMVAVRKAFGAHSSAAEGSGLGSTDMPEKISMEIKDPLLSNGLSMDQNHWKLMNTAFGKKITDIKSKFGVDFMEESSQGKVKVSAKPKNVRQAASLESHALRALMHLYQRVATTTMSCYLQYPGQPNKIRDKLEEIRPQHPYVWEGEQYVPWRLIGLPDHLGPAIKDLEVKLGGPVFKEEDKQKIGHSGDSRSSVRAAMAGATGGGGETAGGATGDDQEETCPICMDTFNKKTKLDCGHEFCKECIRKSVEHMGPSCPVCKKVFGKVEGNQPDGTMSWTTSSIRLPGFPNCGMIIISYYIPSGQQTKKHENPGNFFTGTQRTAYLPDNMEGNAVLQLLKRAFDQKLIFTVGTSRTSGAEDSVTWNDIHHKTNTHGGPQGYGYPDPNYLSRVKEELKAKGVE